MSNLLAGAGPTPSGAGGNADGPPLSMQGTNGATPQASPNQPAPNMLAGGGMPPGGLPRPGAAPATIAPPSIGKLHEVYHKQAYTLSALKGLLNKPELSTKDVLNEVGEAVANGIMGPFDAADQLKTMPAVDDSLAIRQWVGQHYANASQALQTVSEMIAAHGEQTRRRGMMMAQAAPQLQNGFTGQNG